MIQIPMKHISGLLMGGLLGISGQAAATTLATIDWSSFQFTLYDLNPRDAITPSLSFFGELNNVFTNGLHFEISGWSTPLSSVRGSATAMTDGSTLTSIINGGSGVASVSRYAGFFMLPRTRAVFSVPGSIATSGIGDSANISIKTWKGGNRQISYDSIQWTGSPYSQSGTLTVTLENLDPYVGEYGFIYASASTSAPVPEPETYALMLAGLGLLGWLDYRRRA